MELKPKYGIGELLFGMKQKNVENLLGKADKQFKDDDGNEILVYNAHKLRLTFYEDEDFKLGYLICSHPNLLLFGKPVIGREVSEVKQALQQFKTWEQEDFDVAENHFNEDHWLILQTEFGEIANVEIGAIINDNDDFDWKFTA